MNFNPPNYISKIQNAAAFFVSKVDRHSAIKLYVLFYLLDFLHYAKTGRSVTAMNYSPVIDGIIPNNFSATYENAVKNPNYFLDNFTKREAMLMDELAVSWGLLDEERLLSIFNLKVDSVDDDFIVEFPYISFVDEEERYDTPSEVCEVIEVLQLEKRLDKWFGV